MTRTFLPTLVAVALATCTVALASADEDKRGEAQPLSQAQPELGVPVASNENKEVDLIPAEIQNAPQAGELSDGPAPRRLHAKSFVEDVLTLDSPSRPVPVPYPLQPSDWQNRTSLDLYLEWSPGHRMTLVLSNRLNLLEQDDVAFLSRQTVRNDLREAYLSCEVAAGMFLEAGRINVRNGAALGFNPTDFFKTRTLVGQASLDPSIVRQNRLGTLMVRGQEIWSSGAVSLAFAPKLFRPSAIVDDSRLGVDPRFDATNAQHRVLGALSLDIGSWSPQLLGYFERGRSKVGFNLSRPFGDAVVASERRIPLPPSRFHAAVVAELVRPWQYRRSSTWHRR